MYRIVKYVVMLAVILIAAFALHFMLRGKESEVEVGGGMISDVETMAQLCTIDLYSEVPILDTINNKVIFAIQKQTGSITFDMENMQIDATGDTIVVNLPRELIQIREATEDNSWEVIDTKNIGFLGAIRSDRLSVAEENKVKAKAMANARRRLYQNGTVRRAREEAAEVLEVLLEKTYRVPVIVRDTAMGSKTHN